MNKQKLEAALELLKDAMTEDQPKLKIWARRGIWMGDKSMYGIAELFTCEIREYLTDEQVGIRFPGVKTWIDPEPRLWGEYDEDPPER